MNGNTNVDNWAVSGNNAHDIVVMNKHRKLQNGSLITNLGRRNWRTVYNNTELQIAVNNN